MRSKRRKTERKSIKKNKVTVKNVDEKRNIVIEITRGGGF